MNPPAPTPVNAKIQDWSAAPGLATPNMISNVQAAWAQGVVKFSLSETEIPFMSGAIQYIVENGASVPLKAVWEHDGADTACKLTVKLNRDGSYLSASGVCRPK